MDMQSPMAKDEWEILESHVNRCGFESSSSPTRMMFERSKAIHDYAVGAAGRRIARALVLSIVTVAVDRLVTTLIDRIDFPGPQYSDKVISSLIKPLAKYVAVELIMYAYDKAVG